MIHKRVRFHKFSNSLIGCFVGSSEQQLSCGQQCLLELHKEGSKEAQWGEILFKLALTFIFVYLLSLCVIGLGVFKGRIKLRFSEKVTTNNNVKTKKKISQLFIAFSADVVLKMTTILKEMRIAQLSFKMNGL